MFIDIENGPNLVSFRERIIASTSQFFDALLDNCVWSTRSNIYFHKEVFSRPGEETVTAPQIVGFGNAALREHVQNAFRLFVRRLPLKRFLS